MTHLCTGVHEVPSASLCCRVIIWSVHSYVVPPHWHLSCAHGNPGWGFISRFCRRSFLSLLASSFFPPAPLFLVTVTVSLSLCKHESALFLFPLPTAAAAFLPFHHWNFPSRFLCPLPSLLCLSWPFPPWLSWHYQETQVPCGTVCCDYCPATLASWLHIGVYPLFQTHSSFPFSFCPNPWW